MLEPNCENLFKNNSNIGIAPQLMEGMMVFSCHQEKKEKKEEKKRLANQNWTRGLVLGQAFFPRPFSLALSLSLSLFFLFLISSLLTASHG